jgi:3-methylcrotonyl-CoA carboxylase alpha subunit
VPEIVLLIEERRVRCEVARQGEEFVVRVDGETHRARLVERGAGVFHLRVDGRPFSMHAIRDGPRGFVHVDGQAVAYTRVDESGDRAPATRLDAGRTRLAAPMPGTVLRVLVAPGDAVAVGQALAIVEAMKMEHVIRAPRPGRVRAVRVRAGDQVEGGASVVELDAPDDG